MSETTPPATDPVLVEHTPFGVTVITFNRPEVHNALNFAAMERFAAIIEDLHARTAASSEDVGAVVVTGAGNRAFCSGGDQQELAALPEAEHGARLTRIMGDALRAMERLPVPVLAAVNGYALGGGSEVALACDLRVVAEDATLGVVHLGLGLIPGWGAGQRLMRLVGYSRALDMMLTTRRYRATELQAMGLANRITASGHALLVSYEIAKHIASLSPDAVRAAKAALQDGWTLPYDQALAAERARFPELWTTDAHQQAVAPYLARKK